MNQKAKNKKTKFKKKPMG